MKLADELTISAARKHKIAVLVEQLRGRVKSLRKSAQAASRSTVVDQARALAERQNGRIIVEQLSGADKDSLLAAMDVVRAKHPEAAAMLLSANEIESKVFIVAAVPKSIIDLGLKAGDKVVAQGIGKLFGPGTPTTDLIDYINEWFSTRQQQEA